MEDSTDQEVKIVDSNKEKSGSPRIEWRNKFEFALNVLGYNVGIGNIWRFSYLCFKDGGGAFLVPYVMTAILVGIPILFLEVALGQFTRHGCIAAWNILPLMRGIGLAQLVIGIYFNVYFVYAMAWCVFYMTQSFTLGELPWTTCGNWWNTDDCVPVMAYNASGFNNTGNSSLLQSQNKSGISSTTEYWDHYVLQRTEGIEDMGSFTNWKMLGSYVAAWIACFLCICKGIRTSGKAAYITVISPYVLMLALFFRGVTLEGAGPGVLYYITPNITRLADPVVWLDAGGQIIFSLGVCFGCLQGLGSYNKRTFDCYKSAYIFVASCCGSSLFFGFVVFCFVGHMAHVQGKEIEDVVAGGPGLVFKVFPTEFAYLPASPVWSVLFFASLTMLAIDGVFSTVEGVITAFADYWPNYFGHKGTLKWRAGFCLVTLLLGLPQIADGGVYVFELLNMYSASGITLLLMVFLEMISIAWLYGIDRFFEDVKSMIGYYPHTTIKYCLKFVAPGLCMIIFIASCVQYTPLKLGDYTYPGWANAIGWLIILSVLVCIPGYAINALIRIPGSWKEKWKRSTTSMLEESDGEVKDSGEPFIENSV